MAKIKLSMMISEMRGKLNGSVFSKNRGGAYVRTKVTPVNPSTIAQGVVRAALTSFSQGWRALTATQRNAWNGAVNNWASTDIFGDIKNPSGINLYTKLNLNLANAELSGISMPPLPSATMFIDSMSIVAAVTGNLLQVTYTAVGVDTDNTFIYEATPLLSPGISNAKSKYAKISVIPSTTGTTDDIWLAYTTKYGPLVAGQKVFVRVKSIQTLTGTPGPYRDIFIVVSA